MSASSQLVGATGGSVNEQALRRHLVRLGMWMFLGTVTMLFAAFSSAYIVRGASPDWKPVALPWILSLNTAVVLASSGTMALCQRAVRRRQLLDARAWILATWLFGLAFLSGQVAAWRQLYAAGVTIPSTPHGSFFFVLTGLHGLHLLAGLVVLSIAGVRIAASTQSRPTRPEAARAIDAIVEPGAIFWHFLAGLWIYLFALLALFG